jgi:hypothetical protein
MFPFSYTGLRVIHDEEVREAMEQAHIDAELARGSRQSVLLSLLRNALAHIHRRLNVWLEHLRYRSHVIVTKDMRDSFDH